MPRASTPSDDDPDALYAHHFQSHLAHTRAHLAGTESNDDDDDDAPPLQPSFHLPTGYWTPADKNAFFHALSVHSRLRPDLIAHDVRTKTLVDVCAYIDELEDAAHALEDEQGWEGRESAPQAVEVSDEWMEKEDKMADALAAVEQAWEGTVRVQERKAVIQHERARLKAASADAKPDKCALAHFKVEREAEWAREDAFIRLDTKRLCALDRILRDEEEKTSLEKVRQLTAITTVKEENTPLMSPPLPEDEPVNVFGANDVPIDPDLLTFDTRPQPMALTKPPAPHPYPTPAPSHPSLPPLSDAFSSQRASSSPAPIQHTPPIRDDPEELDGAALAALSPTSRRRHQKRMYMRKKRAEASGSTGPLTHVGRLKPGRKPKDVSVVDPATTLRAEEGAAPSKRTRGENAVSDDDDEDEDVQPRKRKKSGLPKEYRLRREFEERYGYDADALREMDLDMFHFSTLGKLMGVYKDLHDVPEDVLTSINGTAVQLLHDLLVPFVRDAVRRTIWVRTHQVATRSHTKVWRLGISNKVRVSQVRAALELMGCETLDRREHFSTLLPRLGIRSSSRDLDDGDPSDSDGGAETDDDDDDDDGPLRAPYVPPDPTIALGLSTLREVHTPAVRLPPRAYPPAPDAFELRLLRANRQPVPVDPEVESDDDRELEELEEETRLDKKDAMQARVLERALWAAWVEPPPGLSMGGRAEGLQPTPEEAGELLRLVEPGTDRVKSQVYVVDSD